MSKARAIAEDEYNERLRDVATRIVEGGEDHPALSVLAHLYDLDEDNLREESERIGG